MKKFLVPLLGILFGCWLPNRVRAQTCTTPTVSSSVTASGGTVTICAGSSVTLTSSSATFNKWSTGETTQSISVSAAGTYTVQNLIPGTCTSASSNTITVVLQAKPLPQIARVDGNTALCSGESVTIKGPAGFAYYLWSNGETTPNITVSTAGSYSVRVANLTGCFSDTAGGFLRSGVSFYPVGAGADDSVMMVVNPAVNCTSLKNLAAGDSMHIHGGVKKNSGGTFQNVVAANSTSTIALTKFTYANGIYYKWIKPRTYFGLSNTDVVNQLTFVLTGGAFTGGWFEKEGKDGTNGCGDYLINMPLTQTPSLRAQAVVVTQKPVTAQPTISITGSNPFCQGDSIVLSGPTGSGMSWLWSTGETTQSIKVKSAGSFTLTTTQNGCVSVPSATLNVSVTPKPATPTITAGGPLTFCNSGSVTLTASASGGYLWSTGATSQSITVTTAGSYTVQTISNGCTSAASAASVVAITSNSVAPTVLASGPLSFCEGGSVTLSGPPGYTYAWSNGATTQSITVTQSGTFSLIVSAAGCTSAPSTDQVVSVTPYPSTPTVTLSGNATFCSGDSVVLTSSLASGNIWSNGATTQSITVKSSGTYSVAHIDGSCTSLSSTSTVVTVNARPGPQIARAVGSTTACAGSTVTLTGPDGFNFYLWSNGETTKTIQVGTSGHYSVRTAFTAGCWSDTAAGYLKSGVYFYPATATADDSILIIVNPAVNCTSLKNLVAPDSMHIHGGVTKNGGGGFQNVVAANNASTIAQTKFTYANGQYYKWIKPRSYFAGQGLTQSDVVTKLNFVLTGGVFSNGWFAKEGKDGANGCGDYNINLPIASTPGLIGQGVDVNILPAVTVPTVTNSTSNPICQGDTMVLTGPANQVYLWSTGETSRSIKVTTVGSYSLRRISAGCTSLASQPVVLAVTPKPATPTITANGPITFCNSGTVDLTSSATTGNIWSTGETTRTITVTAAGSYTVKSVVSGCTSASSTPMDVAIVSTSAVPNVSASGPLTFCQGGNVVLSADAGYTYLWSNNKTTQSITVTQTGDYSVQLIAAGCTSVASTPISVTVTPLPFTPVIVASGSTGLCTGGSVTLSASSIAGGYLWSNGAVTQSITVSSAGTYTVQTINNGCTSAVSAVKTVTFNPRPLPVKATAVNGTTACAGGSVLLSAPAGYNFYLWSNGATTRTTSVSVAGHYTVQVAFAAGCYSDTGAGYTKSGITLYPTGATASDSILITVDPTKTCGSLVGLGAGETLRTHGGADVNGNRWSYVVAANDNNNLDKTAFTLKDGVYQKRMIARNYYGINATDPVTELDMILTGGDLSNGWFPKEGKDGANGCGDYFLPLPVQLNTSLVGYSGIDVSFQPVIAPPTITLSSGTNPLCQSQVLNLSGPAGFDGYIWSTGAKTQTIDVGNPGTYKLKVISGACTSDFSTPYVVTLTPVPAAPTVTVSGPTSFCTPGSVTLTSSAATGNVWSTGETTKSITVSTSGSYTVQLQVGACLGFASTPVTVTATSCGYTFISNGGNNDWNNAANWSTGAVPTASDSITIYPFPYTALLPANTGNAMVKSVRVMSGASFTVGTGASLTIKGNLRNEGKINTDGKVTFSGNTQQYIWGKATFNDVVLNNAAGLKMNDSLWVKGKLDVQTGSFDVNNKVLVLKAVGTNSGYLGNVATGSLLNAGNTIAQHGFDPARNASTVGGNWYFVAPPVKGQTVSSWTVNNNPYQPGTFSADTTAKPSVFFYDPTDRSILHYNGFVKPTSSTQSTPVGTGLRVWFTPGFLSNGGVTWAKGEPFLGDYTWSGLKYCNSNCAYNLAENGFNLVGNPYAAPIDWSDANWTKTNIASSIYIYKGDAGSYASYMDGVGGVNGGDNRIAKGQSFFVQATAANPVLKVTPSAVTTALATGNPGFLRTAAIGKMKLEMSVGTHSDEILLSRNSNVSVAYNAQKDAEKMYNSYVNLAFKASGKNLAITSRPVAQNDTLNLMVYASVAGNAELKITRADGFGDLNVFLLDRVAGTIAPVAVNQAVPVHSDASGSRYALVFSQSVTLVAPAQGGKLTLYPNPTKDVVYIEGLDAVNQPVIRLTDMLGHEISIKLKATGNRHSVDISSLANGVYRLQINGRAYQVVKE